MSLVQCKFIFLFILVAMDLHFSKTDARLIEIKMVREQLDVICKQTQDYNFCMNVILSDPRAANVDSFYKLAVLSLSITISQIQDSTTKILQIAKSLSGENGVAKQRIEICQLDYNEALGKFQAAYTSLGSNSYMEVINWVRDGTTKVIDCGNIYRRNPVTECPVDDDNIKMF